jgi:hypothetical protein
MNVAWWAIRAPNTAIARMNRPSHVTGHALAVDDGY